MSNYNFNCNRGICRNTYYNYGSYLRARGNEKQICDVIKGIEDGTIIPNIVSNGGTINGDLTILGNLVITGNISIDIDSINFTGTDITIGSEGSTITLLGNVQINGTLDVDEDTTLNSNLTVSGETVLNNNLTIDGSAIINEDLTVSNQITTESISTTDLSATDINSNQIECVDLTVSKDIIYTDSTESGVDIGNGISIPGDDDSALIIYGNCTISNYKNIYPETNNGGNLTVENNLTVMGNINVENDLIIDGEVSVNQISVNNLEVNQITGQNEDTNVTINNQLTVDNINVNTITSEGNIEIKSTSIFSDSIIVDDSATIPSLLIDEMSSITSQSININADLNVSENTITANEFIGDGSQLTNISFPEQITSLTATGSITANEFIGNSIEVNQVTAPIITTITTNSGAEIRDDDEGYILTPKVKCNTISNSSGDEEINVNSLINLVNGINVDDLIDLVNLYKGNQLVTINQNQEYVMNATRGENNTVEFTNVSFTLPSE